MSNSIYQFKIELKDTDPLIWRRIAVPDTYTFWDLHVAIQDAMGWADCHLHNFKVLDAVENKIITIGIPDEEFEEELPVVPGWEAPITNFLTEEGEIVEYVYDFGDDWEHKILLESILPAVQGKKYPLCLGGERNCPPEDSGGVPGYDYLLEVLADPKHEEYEAMTDWLGGDLDPDYFDCSDVKFENPKKRLKKILR
ncbi:plasmid pRiA4b ORF-3 family protein [candidate division KSB1 bacterium]|nr:plasmid pRiA4b ORF-3 family protein [candidate division KSB1 bacterium]